MIGVAGTRLVRNEYGQFAANLEVSMMLDAGEIARLGDALDRGLSLPANWYTDSAIATLEQDRIFRRSWQYAGRAEQVARVGEYFTAVVGELPIVVVRAADGLRAFVNVCRHRRHEVASGAGSCKILQCPYHGWTYELDGRLRTAPRSEREPAFRKEDYPLIGVQVDTWGPWVFVNPAPDGPPLTTILGDLPDVIARGGVEVEQLRFRGREEWAREANWKVMIENYLECYHCPVQHPGFSAVIDVHPDAYSLASARWSSSQVGPLREMVAAGKAAPYDTRGTLQAAQYHYVWPNLTISINPGQVNLSLDVWIPDGAERTRGFSEHYFGPGVPDDWARELEEFNARVGEEDDRLTDSVQRGLRGSVPAQGRFLTNSEHLLVHFQKLVLAA